MTLSYNEDLDQEVNTATWLLIIRTNNLEMSIKTLF